MVPPTCQPFEHLYKPLLRITPPSAQLSIDIHPPINSLAVQVTAGSKVMKPNVIKLRRLAESVVGGFAGSTADALTLFERLEAKLEAHPSQLRRASVELAKDWRQDKVLRRLEVRFF